MSSVPSKVPLSSYFNPTSHLHHGIEHLKSAELSWGRKIAAVILGSILSLGVVTYPLALYVFRKLTKSTEKLSAQAAKISSVTDPILDPSKKAKDYDSQNERPEMKEKAPTDGVVKETKKLNPPTGFVNAGNTCWIGSGLQVLLANQSFEKIVRAPLKRETVDKYERGVPVYRPLTAEELQQREQIKTALIKLIDLRKEGSSEAINNALINLHKTILENNILKPQSFPPLSNMGDSKFIILWLGETFGFSDSIITGIDIRLLLDPSTKNQEGTKRVLNGRLNQKMHDLISIVNLRNGKVSCDLNALIDLSEYTNGKAANYKIVGVAQYLSNHWVAFVRNQDQWFYCNDGQVLDQRDQTIMLDGDNHIVLERISP